MADSQVYGFGVGEVGSLGVWRCRTSPQGVAKRMRTKLGRAVPPGLWAQSPRGGGKGFRYALWLEEKESYPHELPGQPYPASFLPQPGEGREVTMVPL